MTHWQPILQGTTLNFGWPKEISYSFAALDTLVPITLSEMASASRDLVMLFAYNEGNKKFSLGALQSLQPGLNVYVSSHGRWLGKHIPLHYRGAPFGVLKVDDEQVSIYFDEESPLVHSPPQPGDAQLYADAEGEELSEDFHRVLEHQVKLLDDQEKTQALVDQCAALDLIEPWELELDLFRTGEPLKIAGLYHITREAVEALSDAQLGELTRSGAMHMIVTHQQSFTRFHELANLYIQCDQVKAEMAHRRQAAKKAEIQLDDLKLDEDELFKF